jgi:hypothetical protein
VTLGNAPSRWVFDRRMVGGIVSGWIADTVTFFSDCGLKLGTRPEVLRHGEVERFLRDDWGLTISRK